MERAGGTAPGRGGGGGEALGLSGGPLGTSPPPFITLSHRPVTLLSWPRAPLGLDLVHSKPRVHCGAFLWLLLHSCSPDKEIFQRMLPVHRRKRVFADSAMDQSMREVGVSFHAHDLITRPAVGAQKFSRMVLGHLTMPGKIRRAVQ